MRGTFIREIASMLKTVVTQDTISSSDDMVSKGLFPKDTDIKQINALKKLLEMVIAFLVPFQILFLAQKTITLSVGYCAFMSWLQTISNTSTQAMKHIQQCQANFLNYNIFSKQTSISGDARVPNDIPKSLKN